MAVLAAAAAFLGSAQPASAHGFSSVAYVDVGDGGDGRLRTKLQLEYDLYVVSAADAGHDDALFRAGTAAFDSRRRPGPGRGPERPPEGRRRLRPRALLRHLAGARLHP